ncbi:MAG: penicillin-binding protein 2 [Phaeodactylibacter sp.]|nr:penicillin-binding protein 2 [Phaeodactylibacter sp.]MCB9301864.1 penicillin-binding protein 2 [Lewinellaceae bacterium]HQU58435.1 penicillin-binding protein 2 [Saprospiraceae bacterium]
MSDNNSQRQYIIRLAFLLASVFLVSRAMQLQLIDSSYRTKADATAIDQQVIYPARGTVYDRNGNLLVYNEPTYDLMVTYNQMDPKMDTTAFCELLNITKEYFVDALDKNWRDPRYSKSVPFPFLTKISAKGFASFEERLYQFPGFRPVLRHARGYPHHNAAHLLGYIREVNREDIDEKNSPYSSGDYIGAGGLELAYEDTLRGNKGLKMVLKDNLGREVESYQDGKLDKLPVSGKDLQSTIDLDLQKYGEELMQNKIGSIVAIDPKTGEVLAMVSTPTYDPNVLAIDRNRGKAYASLVQDPNNPLFDRSIMAQYPPGSLFKPIVALIGMQTGVLSPDRSIPCSMGYYSGGMRLTGCHGHPQCTNVESAIQHSCNAYFVTVFRDIVDHEGGFYNPQKGLDVFNSYLEKFGLGQKLGIDLPREKSGFFPTSKYYDDRFEKQQAGQKWNSLWVRSLGIGQGELLLTNLQMANVAAIIANRGYYYTPHLVKVIMGDEFQIPKEFTTPHSTGIDKKYFDIVANGMEKVVLAGTARIAQIPGTAVCGKTGTAENPHGKDHSIFLAFAPKDDPKIAIAVYVENAGFGGSFAAPIASLMIEKMLNKSIDPSRAWLEQRMKETNLMDGTP